MKNYSKLPIIVYNQICTIIIIIIIVFTVVIIFNMPKSKRSFNQFMLIYLLLLICIHSLQLGHICLYICIYMYLYMLITCI